MYVSKTTPATTYRLNNMDLGAGQELIASAATGVFFSGPDDTILDQVAFHTYSEPS